MITMGANPHPDTTEAINGIDDNCNGLIDDGTAVYDDDGAVTRRLMEIVMMTITKSPTNQEIVAMALMTTVITIERMPSIANYYFDGDNDSYGIEVLFVCVPNDEYRAEINTQME